MTVPRRPHESDRYVLKPKCLPTYLVIDASSSMAPHQTVLNETLAHVHASIQDHPRVSEFAHVSLIVFSTQAHLVIEMANLEDVPVMPEVRCNGLTDYGAAFDLLRSRIDTDVDELNGLGMAVLRPVVFLLTDGLPTDEGWESSFQRLADHGWRRHPHVITYGFGDADRDVLRRITTVVGFIADQGTDHRSALMEALGSMLSSLVASSEQGRVVFNKTVPGYQAVEPTQDLLSVPREYLE
ncbi:VWA domain-containing protein [Kitasatospora sp. NPDC058162]|uniref:vWA domain-containing protein n=1 Tax=Kitasatospora sp. NPDC058162 TaxID=3346362 RepID=UPI0036D9B5D6